MRQLAKVLQLFLTIAVSYSLPWALVGGVIELYPAFPESWVALTMVVLSLAAAFVGGAMLGRSQTWRGQVLWIIALLWFLAVAHVVGALAEGSGPVTTARVVDAALVRAEILLLAVGMTFGLQIGARFMRPFESSVQKTSESQTSR